MTNYSILLPPSEGKKPGGDKIYQEIKHNNDFSFLEKDRDFILDKLTDFIKIASQKDLEKLFAVKSNLDEIIKLFVDFNQKATLPAIERYSGVMFQSISYKDLDSKQKNNANQSILFIDALFGLLKPLDLIPDYKLSISSKIKDLKIDNFWKNILKEALKEIFNNNIIIDILPEAHRKAIIIDPNVQHYKINFFIEKNAKIVNAGHISKKLKGEFIRYILNFDEINLDILYKFSHSQGYIYSKELSSKNEIIFLKK